MTIPQFFNANVNKVSKEVTVPRKNVGSIADSRQYAPEKIRGRNSRFSYSRKKYMFFAKFCFFCYAPKRPSPLLLYIPHKKTLF